MRRALRLLAALILALGCLLASPAGCKAAGEEQGGFCEGGARQRHPALRTSAPERPVTKVGAPDRLVVLGDVHGDMDALLQILRSANLIDDERKWIGGEAVLASVGDIFDRGDDDLLIEELLYILKGEARLAGGDVYRVLGNHEVLNFMGDHSYVTPGAWQTYNGLEAEVADWIEEYKELLDRASIPQEKRTRIAAMWPGQFVARMMAGHSVAMIIGDSLLVHAGVLPEHCGSQEGVKCLERLNDLVADWLLGVSDGSMPEQEVLWGRDGMLWTREYSNPPGVDLAPKSAARLKKVLKHFGVERMIVGHTPQPETGINSAAGGLIWRVDTGMTAMIGGPPEVLEILSSGEIRIVTTVGSFPAADRTLPAPLAAAA